MDKILEIGGGVLMALGGLVAVLHVVAPLTKNEVDNKVLAFLQKAVAMLAQFVSPKAK